MPYQPNNARIDQFLDTHEKLKTFSPADYLEYRRTYLSGRVTHLRTTRDISQTEIAELLGTTRSRIARIENGQAHYTAEELEMLALLLGETPTALLEFTPTDILLLNVSLTNSAMKSALGGTLNLHLPSDIKTSATPYQITLMAYTPDSRYLVTAHANMQTNDEEKYTLCFWSTETGDLLWQYQHPTYISDIAFSSDNTHCVFGTEQDTVIVLSFAERKLVQILDPQELGIVNDDWWRFIEDASSYGSIANITFNEDSSVMVVHNEDNGTLRFFLRRDDTDIWTHYRTISLSDISYQIGAKGLLQSKEYGEFIINQMLFGSTDDYLYLLPTYASCVVKIYWSETTPSFEITAAPSTQSCMDILKPKNADSESFLLCIAGDEKKYSLNLITAFSSSTSSSTIDRDNNHPNNGRIDQIVALATDCILVVGSHTRLHDVPYPMIWNIVSQRGIVLVDAGLPYSGSLKNTRLSPDGHCVTYVTHDLETQVIRLIIQKLNPEVFVVAETDYRDRYERIWADELKEYPTLATNESRSGRPVIQRTFADYLLDREAKRTDKSSLTDDLIPFLTKRQMMSDEQQWILGYPVMIDSIEYRSQSPHTGFAKRADYLLREWSSQTADHRGFLVSYLHLSDDIALELSERLQAIDYRVARIQLRTSQKHPIERRDFLELCLGRDFLRGEFTDDVEVTLLGKFGKSIQADNQRLDFILVEDAHLLAAETLAWIATVSHQHHTLTWLLLEDLRAVQALKATITESRFDRDWLEARIGYVLLSDFLAE
ncbi:MAG: helix-turn-helix transcriptional regulator [Phototrophicaceae bacterium]